VSLSIIANTLRKILHPKKFLLVAANVISSFLILPTLKMEATLFPETSVLTKYTRRHIKVDGFLHSHRREKLKSYLLSSAEEK
jgi:hypothetical protein